MIVFFPKIFQDSQVIGVGCNPSVLSQGESIDVTEAVGIVFGRLIEHVLSQFDGLFCVLKHFSAFMIGITEGKV
jgi:hypothetical protein